MSRPLSPLSYGPPPTMIGKRPDKRPALLLLELGLAELPAPVSAATTSATAAAVGEVAVAATVESAVATAAAVPSTASTAVSTVATTSASAVSSEGAGLGLEAVTAVDGTIATRFERNLGFLTAGGTVHAEEFALWASAATFSALPGSSTVGAPAGFIREALGCVELLLTRGEGESCTAVAAGKRFVGVGHPTPS